MGYRMAGLTRSKSGAWKARKGIPADVRAEYRRLFGASWEATWSAPAGLPLAEAKSRYAEWLAEVEQRIASIRAAKAGRGVTLTQKQARALAGDWYRWFVAKHEDNPGAPGRWGETFDAYVEQIEDQYPSAMWHGRCDLDEWLAEPAVRAAIRPIVAQWGEPDQFLIGQGVALTVGARELFLDAPCC